MRKFPPIALLLLFTRLNMPCVAQQSSTIPIDTAKINAIKDSLNSRIAQVFDLDMLSNCLQVKQIENTSNLSLLQVNTPLKDSIAVFSERYGTDILVHSFINSGQFWPNLFFNPNRLIRDIGSAVNSPAVGFDVRFTPVRVDGGRRFIVDIGNQATTNLLSKTQRAKLKTATGYGINGQFAKVKPDARDSVNASLFRGIATLRGFWEQELSKSNIQKVSFSPVANSKYGFDTEPSELLKAYYESIVVRGRGYKAPWKSVEAGRMDEVLARVTLTDGKPATHKVSFRCDKANPPAVKVNGDGTYTLSLTGGFNKDEEFVEAFYTDTLPGGKTKETVVGKIKVMSYSPVQSKVVPVILNGAWWSESTTTLKQALDEIYKQAAVSWTVAEPLRVSVSQSKWDVDEADGVLLIETSPLKRYSSEMQAIIDKVKDLSTYDSEASYVVITDLPNSQSYAGYMPLNSDFSFIFTSSKGDLKKLIPHELGHGVFCLKHPQDEYKILDATDNLMDKYAVGTTLWKPQWDWIADPSWRLYAFQSEEEGAYKEEEIAVLDKKTSDEILSSVKDFINSINYIPGSETKFSNELLDKYLKTKDGDRYKYQQYLINIKSEIDYLVSKNINYMKNKGSYYDSKKGIFIGLDPEYTISDYKITLFHEYLHRLNDVGKYFGYLKNRDGTICNDQKMITETKKLIFKSKADLDKIIKENGNDLASLVFKFTGNSGTYDPEMYDEFIKYFLELKEYTEDYYSTPYFIYEPTNYIRDELSVYHWCLEFEDFFGGLSENSMNYYDDYIEQYKERIERHIKYERENNYKEEGDIIFCKPH